MGIWGKSEMMIPEEIFPRSQEPRIDLLEGGQGSAGPRQGPWGSARGSAGNEDAQHLDWRYALLRGTGQGVSIGWGGGGGGMSLHS